MPAIFTFHKKEHLCLEKQIDYLFSNGRWLRTEHLRLVYFIHTEKHEVPAQVMFSVSKKNFRRAVKRNLLKRRMREAYRLRKQIFMQDLPEGDSLIHMGFVYSSNELADFACLQNEIKSLLMQLTNRIKKN